VTFYLQDEVTHSEDEVVICTLLCTRSKKFSPKNKKDLGIAIHTLPLKKAKKQGEMPLPSLSPIPIKRMWTEAG